jgi:hypothetical protein
MLFLVEIQKGFLVKMSDGRHHNNNAIFATQQSRNLATQQSRNLAMIRPLAFRTSKKIYKPQFTRERLRTDSTIPVPFHFGNMLFLVEIQKVFS